MWRKRKFEAGCGNSSHSSASACCRRLKLVLAFSGDIISAYSCYHDHASVQADHHSKVVPSLCVFLSLSIFTGGLLVQSLAMLCERISRVTLPLLVPFDFDGSQSFLFILVGSTKKSCSSSCNVCGLFTLHIGSGVLVIVHF